MSRGVAFIVFANWRTGDSGLDTFVRHIAPLFQDGGVDGELVEIAYGEYERRESPAQRARAQAQVQAGSLAGLGLRLALSYLVRIRHDVRMLCPLRDRLRRRVLVTHHFGCETLPLALRVLFPFHRLVAVCHTHPPQPGAITRGDRVRRAIERLVYRAVDGVVYNSAAVREEWRKRLGVKRIKGDVIWYGVDAPNPDLPEDYPPKPEGAVDFVCVSRFAPWKGQRELITAFAKAREMMRDGEHRTSNTEHRTLNIEREKVRGVGCQVSGDGGEVSGAPLLRLILVGNGPTWRDCIQHARDLGLVTCASSDACADALPNARITESSNHPPVVFFLGRQPDGGVYFNGADVAVQLSTEPEAFGIVLLEAMSRGKPVLASRIGGIPEVVADGRTGVLIDPLDTGRTADAIRDLAADVGKRRQLGEAGRERWRGHFTVERMREEYTALFAAAG